PVSAVEAEVMRLPVFCVSTREPKGRICGIVLSLTHGSAGHPVIEELALLRSEVGCYRHGAPDGAFWPPSRPLRHGFRRCFAEFLFNLAARWLKNWPSFARSSGGHGIVVQQSGEVVWPRGPNSVVE